MNFFQTHVKYIFLFSLIVLFSFEVRCCHYVVPKSIHNLKNGALCVNYTFKIQAVYFYMKWRKIFDLYVSFDDLCVICFEIGCHSSIGIYVAHLCFFRKEPTSLLKRAQIGRKNMSSFHWIVFFLFKQKKNLHINPMVINRWMRNNLIGERVWKMWQKRAKNQQAYFAR